MDDKQTVIAAVVYDVQKGIIRKLSIAVIVLLITCGVLVMSLLYITSGRRCQCGDHAHLVGVTSVTSAFLGRHIRQNVKRLEVG